MAAATGFDASLGPNQLTLPALSSPHPIGPDPGCRQFDTWKGGGDHVAVAVHFHSVPKIQSGSAANRSLRGLGTNSVGTVGDLRDHQ